MVLITLLGLKYYWSESSNSLSWFRAKGKIDSLFKQLNIVIHWQLSSDLNYINLLHPYRTGELYLSNGMSIGVFGQIHPILSTKMNLVSELYLFEFNFDLIKNELKKNKITDHIISTGVIFFISVPSFVVGTMMQYYVVYVWKWIESPFVFAETDFIADPVNGVLSYLMPMLVLFVGIVAGLTRVMRAELTEVLTSEFMLLSRTKGLTQRQSTVRHALRNALVPIAPSLIGGLVSLISGSLIIERIFRVPGIGGVYLDAFNNFDYSLLMALLMFYTIIGLTATLVVDLSYGVIDPRIRMGAGRR